MSTQYFAICSYSCNARSGWPSQGNGNGAAVASVADESNALLNLNCACRDDTSVSVYAFEYDDQLWKGNANEDSFGIFGKIQLNGGVLAPCWRHLVQTWVMRVSRLLSYFFYYPLVVSIIINIRYCVWLRSFPTVSTCGSKSGGTDEELG